jgi:hypothetical protein
MRHRGFPATGKEDSDGVNSVDISTRTEQELCCRMEDSEGEIYVFRLCGILYGSPKATRKTFASGYSRGYTRICGSSRLMKLKYYFSKSSKRGVEEMYFQRD